MCVGGGGGGGGGWRLGDQVTILVRRRQQGKGFDMK